MLIPFSAPTRRAFRLRGQRVSRRPTVEPISPLFTATLAFGILFQHAPRQLAPPDQRRRTTRRTTLSDPIEIVSYNPTWPKRFAAQAASLREALGSVAQRIDHVGSTSVPGLAAKPVIDVQISVLSFEPLDAFRLPLERLGYVYRADNPDRAKRYFRETPGQRRTHLHVRRTGSFDEQLNLLFRDYLRTHAEEVAAYAARKRQLAARFHEDRAAYTDAKGPFIWRVLRRADEWAQLTDWQPAPSDA
jgi:GrpB-like predicted nucleotidyltransferase (UPF0157 family)